MVEQGTNIQLDEGIAALEEKRSKISDEIGRLEYLRRVIEENAEYHNVSAQIKFGGKVSIWLYETNRTAESTELLELDYLDWIELSEKDDPHTIWHAVYHTDCLGPEY